MRLKDRAISASLKIDDDNLTISNSSELIIPYSTIKSVSKTIWNGVGTTIEIKTADKTYFLAVVRCILFRQFVLINYLKTVAVAGEIQKKISTMK